jgi:hypothetical protein
LSYLVLLEPPPAVKKKGCKFGLAAPLNESKGFTRATNAKQRYYILLCLASEILGKSGPPDESRKLQILHRIQRMNISARGAAGSHLFQQYKSSAARAIWMAGIAHQEFQAT